MNSRRALRLDRRGDRDRLLDQPAADHSAWNVVFAVIMVSWVFGWTGGKDLVKSSYEQAKVKSAELKEQRRTRRDARHAAG